MTGVGGSMDVTFHIVSVASINTFNVHTHSTDELKKPSLTSLTDTSKLSFLVRSNPPLEVSSWSPGIVCVSLAPEVIQETHQQVNTNPDLNLFLNTHDLVGRNCCLPTLCEVLATTCHPSIQK